MITITEAKALAKELAHHDQLKHSTVLEAVAHVSGCRDWNTFVAGQTKRSPGTQESGPEQSVVPILRMFDHEIAHPFYCDFLGFTWQWQHQFETSSPVYAQVELHGRLLHLSEHHGDATPGGAAMITVPDIRTYRAALIAQNHRNARPAVEENPWGLTMTVLDPFGNRLVFWEPS